jgi:hypothetical protein
MPSKTEDVEAKYGVVINCMFLLLSSKCSKIAEMKGRAGVVGGNERNVMRTPFGPQRPDQGGKG